MNPTLYSLAAIGLYAGAFVGQWLQLTGKSRHDYHWIRWCATGAVLIHTFSVFSVISTPHGFDLSFFTVSSLVAWLISAVLLLSSFKKPLSPLFVGVFPIACIAIIVSTFGPDVAEPRAYAPGILAHILSSILAYSVFTIAALQALLLAAQDHQLKHHHTRGIVSSLPPLQTMESLLFEIIWTGFVLLTLSMLTGVIFLQDIFAQHLAHKTLLSILAWIIFGTLLWGRHRLGWRGQVAMRWTIGGFFVLMLGYFGSKLVLEIILQRS